MAPPAVYALPFFNLYSAIGLFDTPWAVALAHCLFNVPLAVWILEGFVSGVPREIDETAFLDGYSFPKFFVKILIPLIASGIGVAAFFCFMFSVGRIAARAHADVGERETDLGGNDPHRICVGYRLGPAGGGGRADDHSWRAGDLVRAQLHRARFRAGAGSRRASWTTSHGWRGRVPTAIFFVLLALTLATMTWLAAVYPEAERVGVLRIPTTRGDRLFISIITAAVIHLAWIGIVGTPPLTSVPVGEGF